MWEESVRSRLLSLKSYATFIHTPIWEHAGRPISSLQHYKAGWQYALNCVKTDCLRPLHFLLPLFILSLVNPFTVDSFNTIWMVMKNEREGNDNSWKTFHHRTVYTHFKWNANNIVLFKTLEASRAVSFKNARSRRK